jgi:hypothetical protein
MGSLVQRCARISPDGERLLARDEARYRSKRAKVLFTDFGRRDENAEFILHETDHRLYVLGVDRGFLEESIIFGKDEFLLRVNGILLHECTDPSKNAGFRDAWREFLLWYQHGFGA